MTCLFSNRSYLAVIPSLRMWAVKSGVGVVDSCCSYSKYVYTHWDLNRACLQTVSDSALVQKDTSLHGVVVLKIFP